jgi:hypothetical protein
MFGFNRSKYSLVIADSIEEKLLRGEPLSQQDRTNIINSTYKNHFTEVVEKNTGTLYSHDYDEDGASTKKLEVQTTRSFVPPAGVSSMAIALCVICLVISAAANYGYIANPSISNKFLVVTGNETRSLSVIMILASIVLLSPMVYRGGLFILIYIYLIYEEVIVGGLGWINSALLVGLPFYYWIIRRQVKRNAGSSEKVVKAEINGEIERYLLTIRRKVNRRNI